MGNNACYHIYLWYYRRQQNINEVEGKKKPYNAYIPDKK